MWDRKSISGAIKRVDAMYKPGATNPSRTGEQYSARAEKRANLDDDAAFRKRVTDLQ